MKAWGRKWGRNWNNNEGGGLKGWRVVFNINGNLYCCNTTVVTTLRIEVYLNPLYSSLALTKWLSLPVFHLSAQNACIKEIGMFHRMQNASHMKSLQKRVWRGTDHFSLCDHLVVVTTKYYVVTIKILLLLSRFPSRLKCLSSWRHHYTSWQIWVADVTWGCLQPKPDLCGEQRDPIQDRTVGWWVKLETKTRRSTLSSDILMKNNETETLWK